MPDIALVTERRFERPSAIDWYVDNILREDAILADALATHGLTCERVDWARPDVDWGAYRAAIVRTTWDYFDRLAEFTAWLDRAAAATHLVNPRDVIVWNTDKHYLADLQRCGIAVVPTEYLDRGDTRTIAEVMAARGWDEVVIKPAVSGAARHTHRVGAASVAAHEPILAARLVEEAMMIQPFVPRVVTEGEVTVVVIDGTCTHALSKRARPGDFRVQDDHGGTVHDHDATPDELELAARAIAACDRGPVSYGRVDLVRDAAGAAMVMELELVEPELWFRRHPRAAARLADAIARTL